MQYYVVTIMSYVLFLFYWSQRNILSLIMKLYHLDIAQGTKINYLSGDF